MYFTLAFKRYQILTYKLHEPLIFMPSFVCADVNLSVFWGNPKAIEGSYWRSLHSGVYSCESNSKALPIKPVAD